MEALSISEMALRIGAALVCGALVGIERERKQRPAGFRTMILISLGCCGFLLIASDSINQYAEAARAQHVPGTPVPGQAEISRVLQGLMGGIGFMGAGAVLQSKRVVRGLTTAAAVWVVAALGAACGLGFYTLALILCAATLFTLVVLDVVENRYFPDPIDDRPSGKDKGRRDDDNGRDDLFGGPGA